MAGVKSFSLGRGPAFRRFPVVECVERIRRASRPAVFIPNGIRLDRSRRHAAVEPFHRKIMGETGDPHIGIPVGRGILG